MALRWTIPGSRESGHMQDFIAAAAGCQTCEPLLEPSVAQITSNDEPQTVEALILEALARGEINVDDAMSRLDALAG